MHFGQMCTASKYGMCASLARDYGLADADGYSNLAK